MSGDEDALAAGLVVPGVVGADEALLPGGCSGDGAEGEFCAAVDAEVSPADEAGAGTPEEGVAAHEAAAEDDSGGDFAGPGYGKPLAEEARVAERVGCGRQRQWGCGHAGLFSGLSMWRIWDSVLE